MDRENIKNTISETFEASESYVGIPEITDINYDLWLLRITLNFKNTKTPVYVTFETPKGFRVLDEGDLNEFWNQKSRPKGWLWSVKKGGWLDLEKIRPGFIAGVTGEYSEYLILGENECVSVITNDQPTISKPKP